MQQTLRITEIFYSLQGNTYRRLADGLRAPDRLPLRCHYCDTAYAFSGGDVVSLDAIFERVAAYKPRYICVTGGSRWPSRIASLCWNGSATPATRFPWKPAGLSTCHGSTRA